MKLSILVLGFVVIATPFSYAQMTSGGDAAGQTMSAQANDEATPPLEKTPEQQKAEKTFAQHKAVFPPKPPAKAAVLTPLSPRERVVQMLDRFSYGATPGQVDHVMATGADAWFNQQLNPASLPDAAMSKRLAAYPTLNMPASQAVDIYPFFGQISAVMDGRVPYPSDPMENAAYEVAVYRYEQSRNHKDLTGKVIAEPVLTDEQKAAETAKNKARAAVLYGDLMAMPKEQRMTAIQAMSIEDRIALTNGGDLTGDQKNLLFADFSPRERETFTAMSANPVATGNLRQELSEAHVLRDILSDRQLEQVMTNFWFNHFNIFTPKDSDQWYTTSYERDVIRRNSLGKFKDLLLATAVSPAMMVYLDNFLSIGPDSVANGVDPKNLNSKKGNKGLNENYGREVMELHTVSVNGGYSQADVTALAAILTGWGVQRTDQGGGFYFDPKRHEPGTKYWMGYEITDDGTVRKLAAGEKPKATWGPGTPGFDKAVATPDSMKQGLAALTILANAPQTAHFISWLLAQYFVADDPPPSVVARLEKTYMSSSGDIKAMLHTLVQSPEFNSQQYFHNKVKTPEEFIASAFRTTATDPVSPGTLVGQIGRMGMPMYNALPPTGYYLTAAQWMSSTALIDRLNFSYNLTTNRIGGGQTFDAPKLLALGLMTASGTQQLGPSALKPVGAASGGNAPQTKTVAFAPGSPQPATAAATPGAQMTLRVLESTVVGTPVSSQTNQLINKQLEQQPASQNPVDTLKLLTALVLGCPEFQLR